MMLHHERPRAPRQFSLILAGVMLLTGGLSVRAEDKKIDSSLGLIPADAAYYSAMLRNREQFDAAAKSKAWTRIAKLPAYQMAMTLLKQQYADDNGKLAPLRAWLDQPENRELLDVLVEAVSDELFFYGGANCAGFSNLLTQINMARYLGPVEELIRNPKLVENPQELNQTMSLAQVRAVLRVMVQFRQGPIPGPCPRLQDRQPQEGGSADQAFGGAAERGGHDGADARGVLNRSR